MNKFVKSSLLQNNFFWAVYVFGLFYNPVHVNAQITNYISNGSFEEIYNCQPPYPLSKAKYWQSIDSTSYGGSYLSKCNNTAPLNGSGFQYPKTGNSYIVCTFYCLLQNCIRGYMRNRLRETLQQGKSYCVKFHVNIKDVSPRGIDGFGIYFGDNTIDTISKCNLPLSFITPQVKNQIGNCITDTLNWVPITGTFTANGTEKYALIGNFLADNAVTTASIGGPYYPAYWTDVLIDDVSCIDIDMPAFAGLDTFFIPGSSLYLGRERDVGIDEACTWYQLPNMSAALDTAAGIWVTPVGTSTYVVRQEICGNVKWDTVVVRESPLGIKTIREDNFLKVYPIPAADELNLDSNNKINETVIIKVYNSLGVLVRNETLNFKSGKTSLNTQEFSEGVYQIEFHFDGANRARKRFVIQR